MMTVARLLFKRLMPLLAAVVFLALPASSEPLCDPHEQHACAALHVEYLQSDDAGSHDPASHEQGVHAHGNCHVPMTQPIAFEFSALAETDESVPALGDQSARSVLSSTLERPPRT